MALVSFDPIRSAFIQYRLEPNYNYENVTIAAGADLVAGTVVGKIIAGAATGATPSANTGDATIGTVSRSSGAKVGVYTIKCFKKSSSTSNDDALFEVKDPDGIVVGTAAQTVAFAGPVNFTISGDTSTATAVGDSHTVTVAAGSGQYTRIDLTATTGAEIAAGILLNDADAASATVDSAILARGPAILVQNGLTYNASASAGNKATINAQLLDLGMIVEVAAN